MSKSMKHILCILTVCAATLCSCSLATPSLRAQNAGRFQAGVEYNYVRANAPPGGCPCFSLNGADAWLGYRLTHTLSLVGEVAGQHASNINSSGQDLTLISYLFGPSYTFYHYRHLAPFAEVLLGGAHADGSLASSNGSSDDFALLTGGGLDLPVGEHFSWRAARVDYYLTTFANGVNGHQNNLRVSTGLVLSF